MAKTDPKLVALANVAILGPVALLSLLGRPVPRILTYAAVAVVVFDIVKSLREI